MTTYKIKLTKLFESNQTVKLGTRQNSLNGRQHRRRYDQGFQGHRTVNKFGRTFRTFSLNALVLGTLYLLQPYHLWLFGPVATPSQTMRPSTLKKIDDMVIVVVTLHEKTEKKCCTCNHLKHWLAVWTHNCNCHLNSTRRITSHHLNLLDLNVQLHPIGLPPSLSQQIVESHCQPIDTLQNQQPQCEFHCRIAQNQACRSECTPLFGSTY